MQQSRTEKVVEVYKDIPIFKIDIWEDIGLTKYIENISYRVYATETDYIDCDSIEASHEIIDLILKVIEGEEKNERIHR